MLDLDAYLPTLPLEWRKMQDGYISDGLTLQEIKDKNYLIIMYVINEYVTWGTITSMSWSLFHPLVVKLAWGENVVFEDKSDHERIQ